MQCPPSRPGTPQWVEPVLAGALDGRLWHATDLLGWKGIRADGAIRPDARVNYPNAFCRSIGAVSLFDLSQPDASPPAAHWSQWLGSPSEDKVRLWLEVDREQVRGQLLDPDETLKRWRTALDEHSTSLRLIGGIEAAHVGEIPLVHVVRVLRIQGGRWQIE